VKRILYANAILALILLGAKLPPVKLVRLTIINKSGLDIEVELTGSYYEEDENYHYFLRIPEGTRMSPTEKVFTILPDSYKMSVYYVELWDPVYGTKCGSMSNSSVDATHNIRVIVSECNWTPPNAGEPF